MMLDHTVGVHDQVSCDAADRCWRWSARTPTALAMPSSTRPSSTGSTRPPSPGGVLVPASSGRLKLRVSDGVELVRLRGFPTPLARAPCPLCARQPTPKSVVQSDASGHDLHLAKHLDTDSRYRARHRPMRLTPCEKASTGSSASSSNESSSRVGIDPSYLQSASRLRSLCTTGARAKRPRGDGSSTAVVAGAVTTADVTQAKDFRRHPKMPW